MSYNDFWACSDCHGTSISWRSQTCAACGGTMVLHYTPAAEIERHVKQGEALLLRSFRPFERDVLLLRLREGRT